MFLKRHIRTFPCFSVIGENNSWYLYILIWCFIYFFQKLQKVSRCTENVDMKDISSVTIALYCPTTKEEWDSAAKRKKCGKFSAKENFTADGKQQEYHCVINPFLNKTLEVCAEPKILLGIFILFCVFGCSNELIYLT